MVGLVGGQADPSVIFSVVQGGRDTDRQAQSAHGVHGFFQPVLAGQQSNGGQGDRHLQGRGGLCPAVMQVDFVV